MITVASLNLYPVKGLRGTPVNALSTDTFGTAGDRRFMVVDATTGRFLSQRSHAAMATIDASLDHDILRLSRAGTAPLVVPFANAANWPTLAVSIWSSADLPTHDAGPAAAAWLSDALGAPVRLGRIGPTFPRITKRHPSPVAFADGYPWLATNEASLADLNARLVARGAEPVPMNRFRPNLVLRGAAPFAEDTWPRFRTGQVIFRSAGPCARCAVTTTDQFTGKRGKEPLRTLATYRRDPIDPSDVNFGQNLVQETPGTIRVGDEIEILPA